MTFLCSTLVLATVAAEGIAPPATFGVALSSKTVGLGRVVNVSVDASGFAPSAAGVVFWPFVNSTQWGSFVTCAVAGRAPSADGGCTIMLPMPVVGAARIEVAVLQGGRAWGSDCRGVRCNESTNVYPVGKPLPLDGVLSRSAKPATVQVRCLVLPLELLLLLVLTSLPHRSRTARFSCRRALRRKRSASTGSRGTPSSTPTAGSAALARRRSPSLGFTVHST